MQELQADGRSRKGSPYCKRGHLKVAGQRSCRECQRVRNQNFYAKDPDARRATARDYYAEHTVKCRDRFAERYADPEKRAQDLEKQYEWKRRNRGRVNELSRQGYMRNPEKHAACVRSWKDRNPDVWREIRNAAKSRRRARLLDSIGSHTAAEWRKVLEKHGHRCAHASRGDCDGPLQKDHIIPLSLGGSDMAVNLQPLCRRHNLSKSATIAEGTQLGIFDKVTQQNG